MSYHNPMDGIIDIDGFRLHHGRRVRRCNWIRFLTVADCKLEGANHREGENYNIDQQKPQTEPSKVFTTSPSGDDSFKTVSTASFITGERLLKDLESINLFSSKILLTFVISNINSSY